MSEATQRADPLRPDRDDWSRFVVALALSLAIHALLYFGYRAAERHHFWDYLRLPAWAQAARQRFVQAVLPAKPPAPPPAVAEIEVPLVFIEVPPQVATAEPPQQAKYYSDKNSLAANPKPERDTAVPKIEGTQTDYAKLMDVEKSRAVPGAYAPKPQAAPAKSEPLQPTPPPVAPQPEQLQAQKPKPAERPGDLALGTPEKVERKVADPGTAAEAKPGETQPKPARPRTLAEAMARQKQDTGLSGRRMKQEGGVRRDGIMASLDTKSTTYGNYDTAVFYAIQNRWYYLLEQRSYASDRSGRVTINFRLHQDGTVTEVMRGESTVDSILALLCQKAVIDPAPYARWPVEMRRFLGRDSRSITITFLYN